MSYSDNSVDFDIDDLADASTPVVPFEDKPRRQSKNQELPPQADQLRIPPHNTEAEEGLLACCLLDGGIDTVEHCIESGVRPDWFFKENHGQLFETILELHQSGDPIDEIVLFDRLQRKGIVEEVGGLQAIYHIQGRVETSSHAKHFARIVREKFIARRTIRKQREIIEKAYEQHTDPADLAEELRVFTEEIERMSSGDMVAPMRSAIDFGVVPDDDESVLLGEGRYICRGGISATVSTSGMGKSSLVIQEAFCYALGRHFMGIKPNGRLRSILIQSEDDDGDIGEVVQSVICAMELSEEEKQIVGQNVMIVTDKISRGDKFIHALMAYAKAFEPDLVWINPLHAFFKGDISSADDIGDFLREGLARANRHDKWAYMLVHHTTKPSKEVKKEIKWNEAMYDMAGSAEIINAVRAIRILQATKNEGEFVLNLAKRGKRAGVRAEMKSSEGESTGMHYQVTTRIPMKHSSKTFKPEGFDKEIPLIFWEGRELDEEDLPPSKTKTVIPTKFITDSVPADEKRAQSIGQMYRTFDEVSTVTASKEVFRKEVHKLVEAGEVIRREDGKFYQNQKGEV